MPKGLKRLTKQEWMRLELPYGLWTCPDGREVLFNRWYQPIWQRMPGEVAVGNYPPPCAVRVSLIPSTDGTQRS